MDELTAAAGAGPGPGTPGVAAATLDRLAAADDAVLRRVTDADLETVYTGRQSRVALTIHATADAPIPTTR